jgi:hypothetical protein
MKHNTVSFGIYVGTLIVDSGLPGVHIKTEPMFARRPFEIGKAAVIDGEGAGFRAKRENLHGHAVPPHFFRGPKRRCLERAVNDCQMVSMSLAFGCGAYQSPINVL